MSIIETILNILSTIFGGKKEAQPAEQPQPQSQPQQEPIPSPIAEGEVEEYIPMDDPRVAKTNKGKGLVTGWEPEGNAGNYIIHYMNGAKTHARFAQAITDYIKNGIDETINTDRLRRCTHAINIGKDLSEFTGQEIFDSKVYLGKFVILG